MLENEKQLLQIVLDEINENEESKGWSKEKKYFAARVLCLMLCETAGKFADAMDKLEKTGAAKDWSEAQKAEASRFIALEFARGQLC